MSAMDIPGLDVSSRVRARDIPMTAIANVRRKLLLISGAVDATDHDVSVSIPLPEPGRWTVVKAETNLTDQTWVAMQITTDDDTTFVDDQDTMISSTQFSKTFMTPDQRRLTFYQGEVRPGEAAVKMFDLESASGRPAYAHARYSRVTTDTVERSEDVLQQLIMAGMPQKPVLELIVPVTIVG
ncbi:MAG TPA: DUF6423 family protein [Pseudonocardiaceae bacterium]|jgi:hypothetical protein|nr:DUF6423 family protein [Pseudonocardiaceae bacterium]